MELVYVIQMVVLLLKCWILQIFVSTHVQQTVWAVPVQAQVSVTCVPLVRCWTLTTINVTSAVRLWLIAFNVLIPSTNALNACPVKVLIQIPRAWQLSPLSRTISCSLHVTNVLSIARVARQVGNLAVMSVCQDLLWCTIRNIFCVCQLQQPTPVFNHN